MEQVLQKILTKLDQMNTVMVTKDELNEIRQSMATKDELNEIRQSMATKDELNEIRQSMATKDELKNISKTMEKGFEEINKKLSIISDQVAFNTEQNSRINNIEMEVQVIKKAIANL